jgi:hypothetical protein
LYPESSPEFDDADFFFILINAKATPVMLSIIIPRIAKNKNDDENIEFPEAFALEALVITQVLDSVEGSAQPLKSVQILV